MSLPYWGGKARIAADIGNAILLDADITKQEYWEPFAGMASVARICAPKRKWKRIVLNDSDVRIAEYLNALCNSDWEPEVRAYPTIAEWQRLKKAPSNVDNTFYGLLLGWGGHMFAGSRPQTPRTQRYDSISENFNCTLAKKLVALNKFRVAFKDVPVTCINLSFDELPTPRNAIVYCDPPYLASQPGRSMSTEQQAKLEAFCKACLNNECDVYLSNNAVPVFEDPSILCTTIRAWQNFRNQTDSIHKTSHKTSHGRTEMLMKVSLLRQDM